MTQAIDLLAPLTHTLDAKAFSTDPGEIGPHARDWRGQIAGSAPVMFKPSTLEQVKRIVTYCNERSIALLPQGGNTGLVGGSTPQGEALISLKRMNRITKLDPENDSITVEAGTILTTVQEAAAEAGRLFPLSLGSEGSAMIGGLISTNAGGVHVLRYGMMRDLVLGLEVVLPDGRVICDLAGLRKNNTGYDLKQLFIGAEGTLGVITAATLKLFARPASRAVAIAAVDSPSAAVSLLSLVKDRTGGSVAAFELMAKSAIDFALEHVPDLRQPLADPTPWSVLVEVTSGERDRAEVLMESALEAAFEAGLVRDGAIAQSQAQAEEFWRLRESIPEGEKAHGKAAKHDVSVPVSHMAAFMEEATSRAEALVEGSMVVAFGHVGDGNVHFNLARRQAGAGQDFLERARPATKLIYDLVDKYGGSISAEHGIGILKQAELAARKPVEVALMREIKRAIDPKGIMNPRVLLPAH